MLRNRVKLNLEDTFKKISEEIARKRIDEALTLLNYTEKVLENNALLGTISIEYNILTLHTSSYCQLQ
jgi:hypothetical protein